MITLHGGNKCKVTWRPDLSEYEIRSPWKSGTLGTDFREDFEIGHFKWCPILKQWTLIVSDNRSFTFEFTQKVWAALWVEREKITEHASSPKQGA